MTALNTHGSFRVLHPGMLSLLQDSGRFGQAKLGLTSGGPTDKLAFDWLNRLLNNTNNATCIEVSFGGLIVQAQTDTVICLTGAKMDLKINGQKQAMWTTHRVYQGQTIELGFAEQGVKAYLGVAGGFIVSPQFSSTSTVIREKIGGLNGGSLQKGDVLDCTSGGHFQYQRHLLEQDTPQYSQEIRLRVIPGYQQRLFSRLQQRRFFSGRYQVSKQWDRMGYRLEGPAVECKQRSMLSEGIALGAVQIPPDGQPIVLMHDRQTIGGYPKIGSVLSLDLSRLSQCSQGASIYFEPISMDAAHNELHLAQHKFDKTKLIERPW